MNTDEARRLAEGNPLSFLRVARAEIELAADLAQRLVDTYRKQVKPLLGNGAAPQTFENMCCIGAHGHPLIPSGIRYRRRSPARLF